MIASTTHSQAYVRSVTKAPCVDGQVAVGADDCLLAGTWETASRATAERSTGGVTFRLTVEAMADVPVPDAVPGTLRPEVASKGRTVTVADGSRDVVLGRVGDHVSLASNASASSGPTVIVARRR